MAGTVEGTARLLEAFASGSRAGTARQAQRTQREGLELEKEKFGFEKSEFTAAAATRRLLANVASINASTAETNAETAKLEAEHKAALRKTMAPFLQGKLDAEEKERSLANSLTQGQIDLNRAKELNVANELTLDRDKLTAREVQSRTDSMTALAKPLIVAGVVDAVAAARIAKTMEVQLLEMPLEISRAKAAEPPDLVRVGFLENHMRVLQALQQAALGLAQRTTDPEQAKALIGSILGIDANATPQFEVGKTAEDRNKAQKNQTTPKGGAAGISDLFNQLGL